MVFTAQIKPAPVFQPFISSYTLRVFNTGKKIMPMPLHAMNECYMTFFLQGLACNVLDSTGSQTSKWSSNLSSLFVQTHGCGLYQGDYKLFCVQFKSNGMAAIFGIPQRLLVNTALPIEDILGNDNKILTEQFASSADVKEMGQYMDAYLIKKLLSQKHKHHTHTIAHCSDIILHEKGNVSMDALAYHANMSSRTFERRFIDEVGMTPKLYARVTRFFNTLQNKMLHPHKSFTAVAYEGGYYDQAHFIKECREFSDKTPEELFTYTPPPTEKYITKVAY